MTLWSIINSVAIVLLTVALYLTIRQVGLLLAHLGPGGARSSDQGPRVGENIAPFTAPLTQSAFASKAPTLFIFATEYCPVCAVVREAARAVAKHWVSSARLVMVYDSLSEGVRGVAGKPANFAVTAHATLRESLDIRAVPYAVMTDVAGIVVGHGLVNNASHIESLLEIKGHEGASREASRPAEDALPRFREGQREELHA